MLSVLVGAVVFAALPAAARGRTTCEVTDGKIVVTLYIAFQACPQPLYERWVKEIRDVWNGPKGHQVFGECGHEVRFVVKAQNVPKGKPLPRDWHRIYVKPYQNSEASLPRTRDGRRCIAYMGKSTRSPSVRGASIDGVWSTHSSAPVDPRRPRGERFKDAAHEAGHMMGLYDYYHHKTKFYGRNLMGSTSGPHARVTPQLVQGAVEAVTGKSYCPACPAPCDRPPLQPVKVNGLAPGLAYAYYEGDFRALPDFDKLKPKKTGRTGDLELGMAERGDKFALRFTGYIQVPKDGCYTFYMRSDDGSRLGIGGKVIADNDGEHGMWTKRGQINLKAGKHAIRVCYFNAASNKGLALRYSAPGVGKQLVPASALFHKPGRAAPAAGGQAAATGNKKPEKPRRAKEAGGTRR